MPKGQDLNSGDREAITHTVRLEDFVGLSKDWFWETDSKFKLTYMSQQMEIASGIPVKEFIGKKLGEGVGCDISVSPWKEQYKFMARHEPFDDFRFSFVARDGRERFFSLSGQPTFSQDGKRFKGYRGCGRDVTQQELYKRDYERTQRHLREAINAVPYGISLLDKDSRLVFVNDHHADLFSSIGEIVKPGTTMRQLVEAFVSTGLQNLNGMTSEAFVDRRMSYHRNGFGTREAQMTDGRWFQFSEHLTGEDEVVLSWTDITEVKRREIALASLLGDMDEDWSTPQRAAHAAAVALGCRWGGVVRAYSPDAKRGEPTAQVVALWDHDKQLDPVQYDHRKGPCCNVYDDGGYIHYPEAVKEKFPDSQLLEGQNVYSYRAAVIRDGRGRAIGHIFAASDKPLVNYREGKAILRLISRWVEMEFRRAALYDELIRSQERFKDFAETASDWFWEMDEALNYRVISEHADRRNTSSIRRLILNAHKELQQDTSRASDFFDEPHIREIRAHRPFRNVTYDALDSRTGRRRTLKISGRPILDKDGNFQGYRGTGSDITDVVDAHRRAYQAEKWLTEAIESSPEAFALYDKDDRLVVCNEKFLKAFYEGVEHKVQPGMSFEDMLWLHIHEGPIDHNIAEPERWVNRRLKQHKTLSLPYYEAHVNGRHLRAVEHRTRDGGIASFYADITDLRENERMLLEAKETAEIANQSKSEFLANVSHELRTPLNAIIGFSEIIRDELVGPVGGDKYKEYVSDIHGSGMHLMELINDILDLSKAEAGQIEQYEEEVSVYVLIKRCFKIIGPRAEQRSINISHELAEGLPQVWIDRKRFRQIILNLLSNAVKFTEEGGEVKVKVREDMGALRIDVEDTGIGMRPEDIPKALSAFGQVDSSLSRKYEGTGLGLPLTKKLVELNDGVLEIHSALGKGTTVTITFPAHRLRYGEAESSAESAI